MNFNATRTRVEDQGLPPIAFLTELVGWGRKADATIFAPNNEPNDVYNVLRPILGPWTSPNHRRAAMLELMRVHAGFESGWDWSEGVDTTNRRSVANKTGQETGIFQVSFDSEWLGHGAMKPFAVQHDIETPDKFIPAMKQSHELAMEYYARLMRINYRWAGPVIRETGDSVRQWLSRAACAEFETLLS